MGAPDTAPRVLRWRRAFAVVALLAVPSAEAQLITNGGFETGDLTGWTAGGTSRVQALRASSFSPAIAPAVGTWMAAVSTGPGDTGGPTTQLDGNGATEYNVATLSATLTVTTVPVNVSFSLVHLSSEQDQPTQFDDVYDVTLNTSPLLRRSSWKPGGGSPWPDSPVYDFVVYTVTEAGTINGTVLRSGRSAWSSYCFTIADAGTFTLQFRVADQADTAYDSMLLVDDVQAPSPCTPGLSQVTATSGLQVEVKSGSVVVSPVQSRDVAMSGASSIYAFVSSANLTGDNPNAQEQVFASVGGAYERLTAATAGTFGRPALTSSGRFVAFASSADLTGENADGNWEIFRHDRVTHATVQVTSTTGCTSTSPSIAVDPAGDRIAFVSNCTALGAFANADGNNEVVRWNGSGFTGMSTAGCSSLAPSINRLDGRYVAFVSSCNIGGGNADGNNEIFRWDTQAGTTTRLTTSTAPVVNDTPSMNASGAYVAFVSDGDYVAGGNADGNLEVFRWASPSTFLQLTSTGGTIAHTLARLADDGRWLAVERLDTSSFTFTALSVDANAPGTPTTITSAGDFLLPDVGLDGSRPAVALQSAADLTGGNPDGNVEVWSWATFVNPPRTYCATPNVAIPNNNSTGVSRTITVPDTGTVLDVNLWVNITHPNVGDLQVELTSPAGTDVMIVDRPGNPASSAGCTGNDVDATLDDEGSSPVETQCAGTVPTISGTFTPNNALSGFDGQSMAGTWTLRVADRRSQNSGTFNEWCLFVASN